MAEISVSQGMKLWTYGKFSTGTTDEVDSGQIFPGINDTGGKFATGSENYLQIAELQKKPCKKVC